MKKKICSVPYESFETYALEPIFITTFFGRWSYGPGTQSSALDITAQRTYWR